MIDQEQDEWKRGRHGFGKQGTGKKKEGQQVKFRIIFPLQVNLVCNERSEKKHGIENILTF